MSIGIKVTPEQLISLGGVASRTAHEIAGQSSVLGNQIAEMVNSEWVSSASSQFRLLWNQWQSSAAKLNEALGGISQLLISAGTEYAETEQRLTARLSGQA